jgi:DNA-binding winged helix-turn-helix (wHTH) protein
MRYVFGECTLDTEQYILYRPDGPLPLQPKVFQVLLYLLTHRERVIAKQELSKRLWPDQFISDATLEGVIKAVRRAVGDDGRTQWCIQTRRGQGYRFIAAAVGAEAQHNALPPIASAHASDLYDVTRRQLTVWCCHLTSSQAMTTQMESEDFREIALAFQKACTEVIERYFSPAPPGATPQPRQSVSGGHWFAGLVPALRH